jgi:Mycothiol maleylpyruvate isomerase N-terminal domain
MTLNRIQALKAQRQAVLDYCAGFIDDDWSAPSRAAGWRVRDVIAHMSGTCRGLFSRHAITLIFSDDTEQTNEDLLAARRAWPTDRVRDEFDRWSMAFIAVASAAGRPLVGSTPLRVGSLGSYPLRKLASMLVFDWHTHLTYDVAPALNKPAPAIDHNRLAATLEWMLSGLEQMNRDQMRCLDKSLTLTLTGPAGGTWSIDPAGHGRLTVTESTATTTTTATAITGVSTDFPAWATNRIDWRTAGLIIAGDTGYAEKFLDALHII